METVQLDLHPAAQPVPALKYRLLPSVLDRRPGNAAVLYNKIAMGFGDLRHRKHDAELADWARTPLPQFPIEEVERALAEYRDVLIDLELAARCERCDWQLPLRERDFMTLSLPEVHSARMFAWLVATQARLQIARGEVDDAVQTVKTGFAVARHVGGGPTLLHSLVGATVCEIMADQVLDLVQQPDAPNLHWALTSLPRPFVDSRDAVENQMYWHYLSVPEFRDIENLSRSEKYWKQLTHELADRIVEWHASKPWSRSAQRRAVDPPTPEEVTKMILDAYPAAKRGLTQQGWPADRVEKMAVPQVVVLYTLRTLDELQSEAWKWAYLPYHEANSRRRNARKYFDAQVSERQVLPVISLFAPPTGAVQLAIARSDRKIALLRAIEALRFYVATNQGKLPGELNDVTDMLIPADPVTGRPFEYLTTTDGAALQAAEHVYPGLRFEISFSH